MNGVDHTELEEFFFAAMVNGWAAGEDGKIVPKTDGWRKIEFKDEKSYPGLVCVDCWGKNPIGISQGGSLGSTTIYWYGVPLWLMVYGKGRYHRLTLPTLRAALMESYGNSTFCGGRGPEKFEFDDFVYWNEFNGNFAKFSGREYIRAHKDMDSGQLGYHEYHGGLLTTN